MLLIRYAELDDHLLITLSQEKSWIDRKMMDLYNAMEAAASKSISVLRDARKRPPWTVAPIAITNTAELENIPKKEIDVKACSSEWAIVASLPLR